VQSPEGCGRCGPAVGCGLWAGVGGSRSLQAPAAQPRSRRKRAPDPAAPFMERDLPPTTSLAEDRQALSWACSFDTGKRYPPKADVGVSLHCDGRDSSVGVAAGVVVRVGAGVLVGAAVSGSWKWLRWALPSLGAGAGGTVYISTR